MDQFDIMGSIITINLIDNLSGYNKEYIQSERTGGSQRIQIHKKI